jgi:hypothetical protein
MTIQPPAGFERFSPPDGSFSVVMPKHVNQEEHPTQVGVQYVYTSQSRTAGYQVTYSKLSRIGSATEYQILDEYAREFLRGLSVMGGRYAPGKQFLIDGHRACDYTIWKPGRQGKVVFCATLDKALSFDGYVANPGNMSETNDFFQSISVK